MDCEAAWEEACRDILYGDGGDVASSPVDEAPSWTTLLPNLQPPKKARCKIVFDEGVGFCREIKRMGDDKSERQSKSTRYEKMVETVLRKTRKLNVIYGLPTMLLVAPVLQNLLRARVQSWIGYLGCDAKNMQMLLSQAATLDAEDFKLETGYTLSTSNILVYGAKKDRAAEWPKTMYRGVKGLFPNMYNLNGCHPPNFEIYCQEVMPEHLGAPITKANRKTMVFSQRSILNYFEVAKTEDRKAPVVPTKYFIASVHSDNSSWKMDTRFVDSEHKKVLGKRKAAVLSGSMDSYVRKEPRRGNDSPTVTSECTSEPVSPFDQVFDLQQMSEWQFDPDLIIEQATLDLLNQTTRKPRAILRTDAESGIVYRDISAYITYEKDPGTVTSRKRKSLLKKLYDFSVSFNIPVLFAMVNKGVLTVYHHGDIMGLLSVFNVGTMKHNDMMERLREESQPESKRVVRPASIITNFGFRLHTPARQNCEGRRGKQYFMQWDDGFYKSESGELIPNFIGRAPRRPRDYGPALQYEKER